MEYFGTTIKETIRALKPIPQHEPTTKSVEDDKQKAIVRIVVSIILCGVGIYLITVQNKTTEGISLLTLVGGYWLR